MLFHHRNAHGGCRRFYQDVGFQQLFCFLGGWLGWVKCHRRPLNFVTLKKGLRNWQKKLPMGLQKMSNRIHWRIIFPSVWAKGANYKVQWIGLREVCSRKPLFFFTGRNRLQGPVNLPFDLDQSGMIGESTWRASKEFVSLTCCKSRKVPATIALRRTPCRKSTSGFPANINDCMFCGIWSTPESWFEARSNVCKDAASAGCQIDQWSWSSHTSWNKRLGSLPVSPQPAARMLARAKHIPKGPRRSIKLPFNGDPLNSKMISLGKRSFSGNRLEKNWCFRSKRPSPGQKSRVSTSPFLDGSYLFIFV